MTIGMIFKKTLLPVILALMVFGFWTSPDFQEIAAGVAIFLFGMLMLEDGFNQFGGGFLERILEKATGSMPRSLTFGIVSTTLMQSSSLVSVITISFLSAGLISLAAGIGIIFGANIGTTTGAWLVAGFGLKVKISAYALPMLAIGIVLVFQRSKYLRGLGYVLAGVGFLFLGIHHMKVGFESFKDPVRPHPLCHDRLCRSGRLYAGRAHGDRRHAVEPRHHGAHHHGARSGPGFLRERARTGDRRQYRHHDHCDPRSDELPTTRANVWRSHISCSMSLRQASRWS